uniref:Fibrinogen C-terminal domain-containing protein n=1 Tax=Plectus sambesii TaxID=2011161 RepID=A0A914X9Q4_9BILA
MKTTFISFLFCLILRTVVSDFFVNIDLVQFSNGAGFLANGFPCDPFSFANQQCNIKLKICVESINSASGIGTCSTGAYLDLGQVTTSNNSIAFTTNTWYGAWLNPYPIRLSDATFEGLQVKLIAQHVALTDYLLIDQFVWQIRDNSKSGNSSLSHTRDDAPDPTFLSLAWNAGSDIPAGGTTPGSPTGPPPPGDCYDIYQTSATDGPYTITLSDGTSVPVICDITGGGWTVIQSRADTTDFNKTFSEYENYFGTTSTSYWLGLKNMNTMTKSKQYSLKIDLCCGSSSKSETYTSFTIGDSSMKYTLTVNNGTGAAQDGLNKVAYSLIDNGAKFSTGDQWNNALFPIAGCTVYSGFGGWWFGSCQNNLNGKVYDPSAYAANTCQLTAPPNGPGLTWDSDALSNKARMKIIPTNGLPSFVDPELEQQQLAAFCSS